MLPPGHIAAGFLTSFWITKLFFPGFSQAELERLWIFGGFMGFAPDIDVLYYFLKNRTLLVVPKNIETNHRRYLTHVPVLWFLVFLFFWFGVSGTLDQATVLIFWLSSLSHLVLDSIEYGIMWLWPISQKLYSFKEYQPKELNLSQNFWEHTFTFLKAYSKTLSFKVEIFLLLAALITILKI